MELNADEKKKVKMLSPIFRQAFRLLKYCMTELLAGNCDEDEVTDTMTKLTPKEHGYVCPADYWTVDKCLKVLNMDRKQFYDKVVTPNRLRRSVFNNHSLGYKRSDIERFIRRNRDDENERRYKKEKRAKIF